MLKKYKTYLYVILLFAFSVSVEAQTDTTFQNYLDSNISTTSLQNNDLVSVKQVLSNQRIKLQSTFDKRETEKNLEEIHLQISILEKSIVHYVKMDHKVIVNEMDIQKTNEDSELLLARLVYIKSKTWCMEESLQERVNELYTSTKSDELIDKGILEVLTLTETVINNLEKAKSFDRLKYRYSHEIVISNWEQTAKRIEGGEIKHDGIDTIFKNKYNNIVKELNTMIGVLAMF